MQIEQLHKNDTFNISDFLGIGGYIHIFNQDGLKHVRKYEIFQGENICTIVSNNVNKVAVASGQHVKIFQYDTNFERFNEESYKIVSDWILCLKWLSNENIAAVLMHNKLQIWDHCLEIEKEYICEEKCILYSAYIYGESLSNLIIFSGTVFCEILIWKPQEDTDECCILRRLLSHKVSIFETNF